MNLVETLLPARRLQFAESACQSGCRNFLFAATLIVSAHGFSQRGFEEIGDYLEFRGARAECSARDRSPAHWCCHHKRLFGFDACSQENLLAPPRPQHVQIDVHVRARESFAVESALARALHADKEYRLHSGIMNPRRG